MELNEKQLILLDNLIYLDQIANSEEGTTVGKIVNEMLEMSSEDPDAFNATITDEQFYYCKDMVNGMNADQWKNVLNAIASDKTLMNMKITNVSDENDYNIDDDNVTSGFRAACFTNGDVSAVIYRGTVGSNQWEDNGLGGTSTGTPSQIEACQYMLNLQQTELVDTNIYVSGHSKGGNMAQYASLFAMKATKLNIKHCLSFDGQGFSQQFLDYAEENGLLTDEALSKIYKISSEYDIINSLFLPLQSPENTTFIKSSGELSIPLLDNVMVGHIGSDVLSDYKVIKDGETSWNLNDSTVPRPIHAFMSELMEYLYENADIETMDSICNGLMGLLADNNGGWGVFFDCLINNKISDDGIFGNYFDKDIWNNYPDLKLTNEHIEGLGNLLEITDDFLKDGKNKGLFVLTVYDLFVESNQNIAFFEKYLTELVSEKFKVSPNDLAEAMEFLDAYLEEYVPNSTLADLESTKRIKKLEAAINITQVMMKTAGEFRIDVFKEIFSKTLPFISIKRKTTGVLVGGVKNKTLIARRTVYDPIILDLDGDGFNVETKENGTNFDLDKNGFAEKINWTSKDGFLCLDLNGNGSIDDGGELFGDQTLLADGTKAKNGFEALAQYDSNSDGVIDENDEIYGSLRVWVDADGSGTSETGEMKTLAELGITSISLGYENVNAETGTEATIGNTATFTYADGTTGSAGELWVSSDLFDTVDNLDIEIPDDIKELPNVSSIGNVYSLHNDM